MIFARNRHISDEAQSRDVDWRLSFSDMHCLQGLFASDNPVLDNVMVAAAGCIGGQ